MRILKHPYILFGGTIVALLFLTALFAPYLCSAAPDAIDLHQRYQSPGPQHWFGTDSIGRDVFSRTIYGTQLSLVIGFSTRTFSLILGVFIGALSGYYGGKLDLVLQRLVDITLAFPFLLPLRYLVWVEGMGLGSWNSSLPPIRAFFKIPFGLKWCFSRDQDAV